MTSATPSPPVADVPDPAPRPEAAPWRWIRDLGLVRTDGWAGGVCAAIAQRIGVDPIIVRGVFAVATALGLPGLWLYAACWALLPDAQGRIALQLRAGSAPALLGALATAALALLGSAAGVVLTTLALGWGPGPAALFLGLAALVIGLALIVWLARRSAPHTIVPASGDVGGPSDPADRDGAASGAAPSHPLAEPIAPEPSGDMAAWRAQYDAWRAQHEAWRRSQADAERTAREEERARRREQARAFRAEAARARVERRAAKPRVSAAFVAVAAGLALVAAVGAWIGFQALAPDAAVPAAVLAAAAVLALAMIVAGALRRRSGILALAAVVLLAIGGTATAARTFGNVLPSSADVYVMPGTHELVQPFGYLGVSIWAEAGRADGATEIRKRGGETSVTVGHNADTRVEIAPGFAGTVRLTDRAHPNGREVAPRTNGTWLFAYDGGAGAPERVLRLDQQDGIIDIYRTYED